MRFETTLSVSNIAALLALVNGNDSDNIIVNYFYV